MLPVSIWGYPVSRGFFVASLLLACMKTFASLAFCVFGFFTALWETSTAICLHFQFSMCFRYLQVFLFDILINSKLWLSYWKIPLKLWLPNKKNMERHSGGTLWKLWWQCAPWFLKTWPCWFSGRLGFKLIINKSDKYINCWALHTILFPPVCGGGKDARLGRNRVGC